MSSLSDQVIKSQITELQDKVNKLQQACKRANESIQDEDKKNSRIGELSKLEQEAQQEIRDLNKILDQRKQKPQKVSINPLTEDYVNKKCYTYIQQEVQWKLGIIKQVNLSNQHALIRIMGELQEDWYPVTYVKLLEQPQESELWIGRTVEALNSEDGRWVIGKIQDIGESSITVKFEQWNKLEEFDKQSIRVSEYQEEEKFVIPENCRILPSDSDQVRRRKKQKVRALRRDWIEQKKKEETEIYLAPWQKFQAKNTQLKRPRQHNVEKPPDQITKRVKYIEHFKKFTKN